MVVYPLYPYYSLCFSLRNYLQHTENACKLSRYFRNLIYQRNSGDLFYVKRNNMYKFVEHIKQTDYVMYLPNNEITDAKIITKQRITGYIDRINYTFLGK